jgi:putative ABC transport system substrate-binding protein
LHWEDQAAFGAARPGIFRHLAEQGWREGSNLEVRWRQARMDDASLDRIAAELAASQPDAILTESTRATSALYKASRTVPIVTFVADPVAAGFAESLARPGRNVTGLCGLSEDSGAKSVELLRLVVPDLSRIAVVFSAQVSTSRLSAKPFLDAATRAGIKAELVLLRQKADVEAAVNAAVLSGARAVIVAHLIEDGLTQAFGEAAARRNLASLTVSDQFARSYLFVHEPYHLNYDRSFGVVLDKVLRGTRPGDIAFEQPDGTKLTVNRRLAAAMRLELPAELRLRATRFID